MKLLLFVVAIVACFYFTQAEDVVSAKFEADTGLVKKEENVKPEALTAQQQDTALEVKFEDSTIGKFGLLRAKRSAASRRQQRQTRHRNAAARRKFRRQQKQNRKAAARRGRNIRKHRRAIHRLQRQLRQPRG